MPDGSPVSRTVEGAALGIAESVMQATPLARYGVVIAAGDGILGLRFDTLCLHADMEGAVERLQAVQTAVGM